MAEVRSCQSFPKVEKELHLQGGFPVKGLHLERDFCKKGYDIDTINGAIARA